MPLAVLAAEVISSAVPLARASLSLAFVHPMAYSSQPPEFKHISLPPGAR